MLNCSAVPESTPSDAGIAGAGVLLSFIITAGIALVLSATLVFQGKHSNSLGSAIVRKLLSGYSDQQIVTGIGIQSLGLAQLHTLVPYHFFLIWMLGLLSTAVHNAALVALVHDFRSDWVLRWLRQALMLVNLSLSCVCGVLVMVGGGPATLPVACGWETSSSPASPPLPSSSSPSKTVATLAAIVGNCIVFGLATWYLHSRQRRRFFRIAQISGLLLMTGVAAGATARVVQLSQAFGHPSVTLSDNGETQWSFGQLLALLMLALPLVSAMEIARGEIRVKESDEDGRAIGEDADSVPLKGGARNSFQALPFIKSRRGRVEG